MLALLPGAGLRVLDWLVARALALALVFTEALAFGFGLAFALGSFGGRSRTAASGSGRLTLMRPFSRSMLSTVQS